MRVVAETTAATRRVDDFTVPDPFRDHWPRIERRAHQSDDAIVMRAAIGLIVEHLQELAIVALVGSGQAGEARRMHPRRAVQRHGANAGIVGQRRQLRTAAGVARLGQRVLNERGMRLFGFRHIEIRLRHGFQPERGEQRSEFAQLAGVVGGDDDFLHR